MLLGAAVAASLAGAATAAPLLALNANVVNYYAPADTGLGTALPVPPKVLGSYGVPGFYQVDFSVHASQLDAGTSFGLIDWKYALQNLTTNASFPNWQADVRQVDSNGATKGGLVSLWDTNELLGTPPNADVVTSVTVGSALGAGDPRLYVGQPAANQGAVNPATDRLEDPTYTGSIYLNYTGGNGTASFTGVAFAIRNNTTNQFTNLGPSGVTVPGAITFGSVPEPTSLAFLAVGGLFAARRRKA